MSDFVTRRTATENDREEAHHDRRARRLRIARSGGRVRVDLELQTFVLLRLRQLQDDMDGGSGPCSRSRTGAAGRDRTSEGRGEMEGVLQASIQGRRIRRSSRI